MISVDRTVHKETECDFSPGRSDVRHPLLDLRPVHLPSLPWQRCVVARGLQAQQRPTLRRPTRAGRLYHREQWLQCPSLSCAGHVTPAVQPRLHHSGHLVWVAVWGPARLRGPWLSSPWLSSPVSLWEPSTSQTSCNTFSFQHANKETSCHGVSSGYICLHIWVWKAFWKRTFLSSHQGCSNLPKSHLDHNTSPDNNLPLAHPCGWGRNSICTAFRTLHGGPLGSSAPRGLGLWPWQAGRFPLAAVFALPRALFLGGLLSLSLLGKSFSSYTFNLSTGKPVLTP